MNSFTKMFLSETQQIAHDVSPYAIDDMAKVLAETKGRLFILGVGGSAANASHAVNDFRKICGIEAYAPTDNVAEFTARTNDHGWHSTFINWLICSHFSADDTILILSVNGGRKDVSSNIYEAVKYAKLIGAKILGIVGKIDGETARQADVCVIIPTVNPERITPHAEAWQSIILHLLCSHPLLCK